LRKAEREFGDGYFNAVLVDLIKDSDLTRHQEIAEVLKYAYANRPHQEGGAFDRYTICRELIADAISGRARELTGLSITPRKRRSKSSFPHSRAIWTSGSP